MTADLLLALAAYAFVMSITPGPNNAMLLASGANFGLWPTVPHILGVNIGFTVMLLAIGLGAGALFALFPLLHTVLRWGGAAYLCFLAWKLARSGRVNADGRKAAPMTFLEAAAFQWLNPKAWTIAIGAIATYMPKDGALLSILTVTCSFALVNAPCIVAWTAVGTGLRRLLDNPAYLRPFNIGMALLLVASLYPILSEV